MHQSWEPTTADLFAYERMRRLMSKMTRGQLLEYMEKVLYDSVVTKPAAIRWLMLQKCRDASTLEPWLEKTRPWFKDELECTGVDDGPTSSPGADGASAPGS
jgi:hypothetical protein